MSAEHNLSKPTSEPPNSVEGCKRGHPGPLRVYTRPNGRRWRRCRTCDNIRTRLKYRHNEEFRKNELARSKKYYHTKVKKLEGEVNG